MMAKGGKRPPAVEPKKNTFEISRGSLWKVSTGKGWRGRRAVEGGPREQAGKGGGSAAMSILLLSLVLVPSTYNLEGVEQTTPADSEGAGPRGGGVQGRREERE